MNMSFKEIMMANSIQLGTLTQLLIEKGLITEEEFHKKLKDVLMVYESRGEGKAE